MIKMQKKSRNRRKLFKARVRLILLGVLCLISFVAGIMTISGKSKNIDDTNIVNSESIDDNYTDNKSLPLSRKKVIVDAGHGGSDPGTKGLVTGVYEDDISLRISYKLKAELEKLGVTVVMTRTDEDSIALGDTEKLRISERGEIIESVNADMLLSIHQNFNDESSAIRGTQILCYDDNSHELATQMQDAFNKELNTNLSYIKDSYHVLKYGSQPSVIVECGFLSNEEDERLLQTDEYQKRLVSVIVDVVKSQLSN